MYIRKAIRTDLLKTRKEKKKKRKRKKGGNKKGTRLHPAALTQLSTYWMK
jgi:hypothetical protein